ncbi:MAG: ATP-binding protein [Rhodospirillaceae bacterium]|nr:ATP-binding protein [Rhodospirillaceae bacterium]
MKRVLPDSLGGWLFTVLVAAVILIYGSSLVTYFIFRDQAAAAAAASQAADQLIVFKRVIEQTPMRERISLIQGLNSPGLRMVITSRPLVSDSDEVFTSRIVYRRLAQEFPEGTEIHTDSRIVEMVGEERFPTQEEVRQQLRRLRRDMRQSPGSDSFSTPPPQIDRPRSSIEAQRRTLALDQALRDIRGFQPFVRASIRFGENTWLNARVDLDLTEASERNRPFLWTTALTLLIAGLAIYAVRRATKPVSLFAMAAERLGIGLNATPLPETGTGEVRRAARAFNTMQSRLKRFVQDRTQMLAAISHDLRTPITRMRLRAEFVEDTEQHDKMLSDLDDMEAMISATLAFARDDAANEPAAPTDIAALIARIVSDESEAGHTTSYSGPESMDLTIRPLGLKRALTNIVENAIKYGSCAHVALTQSGENIEILVDDKGPGIPDAEKEQVFTPFFRLEGSRSRDTGGTGLGMTIARNAIRSMGGDIELLDRAEGGLSARVTLPAQG